MSDTTKTSASKSMDLMGEAKRLVVLFLPPFIVAIIAKILLPRSFFFLGKWFGVGLAVGIELFAVGLLFWASAAVRLIAAFRAGRLATRGAYGLCRHPIFAWWIYFVLPALALCLDSWLFAALAVFLYFLARDGAQKEEATLLANFGDEYSAYAAKVRRLLPIPRFKPVTARRWGRALLGLLGLGLFALAVLVLVIAPVASRMGTTSEERSRAYAGDELVPRQRQGFTQAITIDAPADAVWPWLVQIGYRRAGWYNVDAINRLAGKDYFYEGNASSRQIIPKFQRVALGDPIALAPGAALQVIAVEEGRLLVLAGDPTGISANNAVWTFELAPMGADRCRLISRFRSIFPGGFSAELLNGFVNVIGGSIIQQPAMFQGIRWRAEASFRRE